MELLWGASLPLEGVVIRMAAERSSWTQPKPRDLGLGAGLGSGAAPGG